MMNRVVTVFNNGVQQSHMSVCKISLLYYTRFHSWCIQSSVLCTVITGTDFIYFHSNKNRNKNCK